MRMPGLGVMGAFQQQVGTDSPPPPAYTHRAQLFFDRLDADGNPLTTPEKDFINDLIFEPLGAAGYIDLNDDTGAGDRWQVVYLRCLGSAAKNKYNILRPTDTDADFRKTDIGGISYAATGETPNGINGYARTYWDYKALGALTTGSYYHYSRTNAAGGGMVGVFDGITPGFRVALQGYRTQQMAIGQLPDFTGSATGANTSGGFMSTHRSAMDGENFRNGASLGTFANIYTVGCDGENYLNARNVSGFAVTDEYDNREHSLSGYSVEGFTAVEAAEIHTIFHAFLTAWGAA